jgi:hypothetical protein
MIARRPLSARSVPTCGLVAVGLNLMCVATLCRVGTLHQRRLHLTTMSKYIQEFMDCGAKAEKGDVAYEDCYAMVRNRTAPDIRSSPCSYMVAHRLCHDLRLACPRALSFEAIAFPAHWPSHANTLAWPARHPPASSD